MFMAQRLLQNQKSLTKTDSLQTYKSSPEHSFTVEAEIFMAQRLLQNQKSLMKTDSPQTHKSSPEHSSTAEA
jgi:hypothetical protein